MKLSTSQTQTLGYHNGGSDANPVLDRDHEEQGFDIYCELAEDHLETLKEDTCPAHLSNLLGSMTNLRKVVLTGDQRARNDCTVPRAGVYDLGCDYLQMLMKALSTAKTPVEELVVYGGEEARALNYTALNMPSTHIQYTMNVFSRLTRLELEIFADSHMELDTLDGSTEDSSPIARVLSYANNLEHLTLTTEAGYCDDGLGDFKTVMLGCVLPKLKSVVIGPWNIEINDLLNFLRGSPGLNQLCLSDNEYKIGSLDDVLRVLQHDKPGLTVEAHARRSGYS